MIAAHRILQEEREVREQIEIVRDAVGRDSGGRHVSRALPLP
jgi:hypothetical protein